MNLLVKSGADLNIVHGDRNRTALHLAAQKGNSSDLGAIEINVMTYFGVSGREKIANVLVKSGANVNSVDKLLRSPLHVAARNGILFLVNVCICMMVNTEIRSV